MVPWRLTEEEGWEDRERGQINHKKETAKGLEKSGGVGRKEVRDCAERWGGAKKKAEKVNHRARRERSQTMCWTIARWE